MDFIVTPTQVIAIYIDGVDETLFLVLHLQLTADGKAWGYGPIHPADLLGLLDSIHSASELAEELPEGHPLRPRPPARPTFAALLEGRLVEVNDSVKAALGRPMQSSSFQRYWPAVLIFWTPGDVTVRTPPEAVAHMVDEGVEFVESMAKAFGSWPLPKPTPEQIEIAMRGPPQGEWLGTYLFPPVRVGDPPGKRLQELATKNRIGFDIDAAIVLELTSRMGAVFVTHEGFVAFREKAKEQATELVNLLSATLLLDGTPMCTATPNEICDLDRDGKTGHYTKTGVPPCPRNLVRDVPSLNPLRTKSAVLLQPADLRRALRRASELAAAEARWALPLLLDASTYVIYERPFQSFLSSWMIAEGFLDLEWERFIEERKVTGERRDGLMNVHSWTAHTKSETLALAGWLPESEFSEIRWARKRRNDILHNGAQIDLRESKKAYQLALRLVTAMLPPSAPQEPG